jgi:GAF domain-containing protein
MLEMLATQAAIAIEHARLYDEARERGARFQALSELSRKMTASLDLQQVFDYAVQAAVNLLNLALARLWVWQELRTPACVRQHRRHGPSATPRETFSPAKGHRCGVPVAGIVVEDQGRSAVRGTGMSIADGRAGRGSSRCTWPSAPWGCSR